MRRLPSWVKKRLPEGEVYFKTRRLLRELHLFTVCEEARCPNVGECWGKGTATFMIMGEICTRKCRFCAVAHGNPSPLDPDEPYRVAEAARRMGLSYVVITSVTRDDLPDGGAKHFSKTIKAIRDTIPEAGIEVLIPDFGGKEENLRVILESPPSVLNHNIETVKELYKKIGRPQSFYSRSLKVLKFYSEHGLIVKSGMMVGLGESKEQILVAMEDLLEAGVKILTIGQYLQPTKNNLSVEKYYLPDEFNELKEIALAKGFSGVESGPLVRSSYKAEELYREVSGLF